MFRTTTYGTLTLRDGVKLQTIITKPTTSAQRLPAILFVQWLSCDSIAISSSPRDGWSVMLRRVVRESGALVWQPGCVCALRYWQCTVSTTGLSRTTPPR